MSKKAASQSRAERAAAALQEQKRHERNLRLAIVGSIVAVLIVVIGGGVIWNASRDKTGDERTAVPADTTDDYGVVLGDESAPKTVTIYEDFLCPNCAMFEEAVSADLRDAVDAGRIQLEFRPVTFLDQASSNEYSSRALNAAMVVLDTAGKDVFWEFHDTLMEQQPAEGGPGQEDDELIEMAVEAGADEDEIRPGIEDKVFEQWGVDATDEMSKNGVNGTPTTLVDGEVIEGESLQEIATKLLEAIG
ncbi:DsbA family protein [Nocardioides pacificus]